MRAARLGLLAVLLSASGCSARLRVDGASGQESLSEQPAGERHGSGMSEGVLGSSLDGARESLHAHRSGNRALPAGPLAESDWRHLLSLLEDKASVTAGWFLGRTAHRPDWVTAEILRKFNRAVSVNLGLLYEPPGPMPELFNVRVGCVEFFLGPEGRVPDGYYGLYILADRQSEGVEHPHLRDSTLFRAIARVCLDEPSPLLFVLTARTETPAMRAGVLQSIVGTAGEWEAHRKALSDALLSLVRGDDERFVADAVRALGENQWLDDSSVAVIRERIETMPEGDHKEGVRRWLMAVEPRR